MGRSCSHCVHKWYHRYVNITIIHNEIEFIRVSVLMQQSRKVEYYQVSHPYTQPPLTSHHAARCIEIYHCLFGLAILLCMLVTLCSKNDLIGRPKGVVHTHQSVEHMIRSLIEAWEWTEKDHILHFLPLHHIHGVVQL